MKRIREITWEHVPTLNTNIPSLEEEEDVNSEEEAFSLKFLEMEKRIEEAPKAVLTPAGMVSLPDDIDPFDFWVGHTNFILSKTIADIISNSEGVEYFIPISPYRFKIAVGRWWVENKHRKAVFYRIQKKILGFFSALEL